MRVRWATPARDDLHRYIRRIAADSLSNARDAAARVRESVKGLASHPLMGRPGQVIDTRELVTPRTSFTAAYRVVGQIVEIIGVVHEAQEWPEGFSLELPFRSEQQTG